MPLRNPGVSLRDAVPGRGSARPDSLCSCESAGASSPHTLGTAGPAHDVLALHEALERIAAHDPLEARLVELRFFGGLTLEQAAECLDISLSTADRGRRNARAWLYTAMAGADPEKNRSP